MDPVTLAAITSGVAVLASEVTKGTASEAGKRVWTAIESLFGWKDAAKDPQVPAKLAEVVPSRPDLAAQVVILLQSLEEGSAARTLVHTLNAKNVGALEVKGDQHNTFQ
jgi:hypothetical protein